MHVIRAIKTKINLIVEETRPPKHLHYTVVQETTYTLYEGRAGQVELIKDRTVASSPAPPESQGAYLQSGRRLK